MNGDGRADVCGRTADGLHCALSNGAAFVRAHRWSFRDDFADSTGWSARASAWGSIRLGDVNGDGLADACGRSPSGLVCAISNGAGFDGARVLVTGLGDLFGWQPDQYGASVALGDLNHDGRPDVCARGPGGLSCAPAP